MRNSTFLPQLWSSLSLLSVVPGVILCGAYETKLSASLVDLKAGDAVLAKPGDRNVIFAGERRTRDSSQGMIQLSGSPLLLNIAAATVAPFGPFHPLW